MLTSVDGGHGGEEGVGGTSPTGGLGPPPPFFFFLEVPECFFFKTAEDFWLVVSLKCGTISQYAMMHEWHHNPSWKMSSWHWFDDDNGN